MGIFTACDNIGTHGWVVTKREAFDFRMTSRVASGHPESWDLGETPPPLRCPARTGGTHVIGRWGTASSRMWRQYAAVNPARLHRDQSRRSEARDLLAPVYGWFTEGFSTTDLAGLAAGAVNTGSHS
jgi:hypothetical protein